MPANRRNFMKSIMQEASSISKAIEQGWYKAGCPQEFSVRILEEPQKNLMGLITTRSAKIALFFDEHKPHHTPAPHHQKASYSKPSRFQEVHHEQVISKKNTKKAESNGSTTPETTTKSNQKHTPLWNDSMTEVAQEWLRQMLTYMDASLVTFTLQPQNFYLRITLSKPILGSAEKEKYLLATLSTLLLETIKKQFKTSLRGHKIVLTHQYSS